jgi:hypothetical protein
VVGTGSTFLSLEFLPFHIPGAAHTHARISNFGKPPGLFNGFKLLESAIIENGNNLSARHSALTPTVFEDALTIDIEVIPTLRAPIL